MKYLHEQKTIQATPVVGTAFQYPEIFPKRMRYHVVVDTEVATIDPTWGQFMSLVGLDTALAMQSDAMRDLYPERRVAVIPKGHEQEFGRKICIICHGAGAANTRYLSFYGPGRVMVN